jgi:hypothetical protein
MSGASERFQHDTLTIDVTHTGGAVRIVWRGESDIREPSEALVPFLLRLADGLKARRVTIDFRKFAYMNSATVSPIIQFVRRLDTNGAETVILYDRVVDWQRVNFNCMKTIARTLSHVQVQGES